MSLFRGTLRPPAILSDEAVERYLTAIREELAPDPLFHRRLRGEVMNRYVAAREGIADAVPRRRSMGKLGRAVLYASFTIALSTTSVLAASQVALPGDVLYPLKRHVESLRMEVLPAYLHHDLAAYELAERIDELARLTAKGDLARATAIANEVAQDYEAFLDVADASGVVTEDRYLTVLTALLDRLPESAQEAVEAVIDRAPSQGTHTGTGTPPNPGAAGPGSGSGQNSSSGAGAGVPGVPNDNSNGDGPDGPRAVEPTPKPSKSPKPQPTPWASSGPNPASAGVPGADRAGGNAGGADNGPDQHDQ
jgi:hypothetical protein